MASCGAAVDKTAGSITVPFNGCYRITFGAWWMHDGSAPYKGEASVLVNNIERWAPSTWGGIPRNGTYPSYVAIMNLNAGDVLTSVGKQTDTFHAEYAQARIFGVELLQKH
jgi:hypothetical protein